MDIIAHYSPALQIMKSCMLSVPRSIVAARTPAEHLHLLRNFTEDIALDRSEWI